MVDKVGRRAGKCKDYRLNRFARNKVRAIKKSQGAEAAAAWLNHYLRYGDRPAVARHKDGTIEVMSSAQSKARQLAAQVGASADPSQVIDWVKKNKARVVRFENVQGYVDAFDLGQQYEIGHLALVGKLEILS
jgi:hypothetical protein